jgi:hypothetical protein
VLWGNLAGAEHASFVNHPGQLPSPKSENLHCLRDAACPGRHFIGRFQDVRAVNLERKIETTDYTDYTDYERVMNFMTPIIWVSLRLDRSGSSYPCNPLQSVKSVVKNAAATFFIFIFLS